MTACFPDALAPAASHFHAVAFLEVACLRAFLDVTQHERTNSKKKKKKYKIKKAHISRLLNKRGATFWFLSHRLLFVSTQSGKF